MAYFGVENVTGRKNPTTLLWNRMANRPRFANGLSRFLLGGMEWNF